MLKLHSENLDIVSITKEIAKCKIKANVERDNITLYSEVDDRLLEILCNKLDIGWVQNFSDNQFINAPVPVEKNDKSSDSTKDVKEELKNYEVIFPHVKRGEVYLCDFGNNLYGHEQIGLRPAIVIQNDVGNFYSPNTIVIPCTSSVKNKLLPTHYEFEFSSKNIKIVPGGSWLYNKKNTVLAEQIRTIDKARLRECFGIMTSEFMDELQKIIDISLGISREGEIYTKEKIVYVDKEVPVYSDVRDLNMYQIIFLSKVNINEVIAVSKWKAKDEPKIKKILELFGFDNKQKGVEYLKDAILIAPKDSYFNLTTLSENIAKKEGNGDKAEITRLISARVKENFKLKKASTLDFIRLVNSFFI